MIERIRGWFWPGDDTPTVRAQYVGQLAEKAMKLRADAAGYYAFGDMKAARVATKAAEQLERTIDRERKRIAR